MQLGRLNLVDVGPSNYNTDTAKWVKCGL